MSTNSGKPHQKRPPGRPPKPSVFEEELVCVVGPRASEAKRKKAFLEATARYWTMRRAIAAAGVTRRVALDWIDSNEAFREDYFAAQQSFLDAVEESLIQAATGRGGRVLRASMQGLQTFLAVHHEAYNQNRLHVALRGFQPLMERVLSIIRAHVPNEVLDAVQKDMERTWYLFESSGGKVTKP